MITRALFEHYLRATGWERSADGWSKDSKRIVTFPGMSQHEIGVQVSILAEAEPQRIPAALVGARLGVCAAAERLLVASDREYAAESSLAIEGRRLLRAAGIDPATWEDASDEPDDDLYEDCHEDDG